MKSRTAENNEYIITNPSGISSWSLRRRDIASMEAPDRDATAIWAYQGQPAPHSSLVLRHSEQGRAGQGPYCGGG